MNFKNLEEIISHFNLETNEIEEIKKSLKNLIKKLHPDKNEGEFKNDDDEKYYHEIHSALEFLNEEILDKSLKKNDTTDLTKALNEIVLLRKEDTQKESISKKEILITSKLQHSIQIFHKQHSIPKITGLIITTVMTTLWAFPNIVKDHPLLSILNNYNAEFTIVWIVSLIVFGIIWLKIQILERQDVKIKQDYKLESTQNNIFSLFINWMQSNHKRYSFRDNKRIVRFSKEDLINFLTTKFDVLQRYLREYDNLDDYELNKKIAELEKVGVFNNDYRRKNIFSPYGLKQIFPVAGLIDMEIAQLICDLIIERQAIKGVITKTNEKKINDFYEYTDEL